MASTFFLYARKSMDSEERQVLSIEAQLTELKAFAEKERLSIVHTYTEAMTAKLPGRPIFNEMVERIECGEANGIIAWHPDRLARNSVDGGRLIYLLDTSHLVALKFPTFWFENTPQGKFMMSIAFGQSKYYVDNLSENVRRGLRQKIRRGEYPAPAPVGYLNDRNLRKVIVDPVKGPLVCRLFELYAAGKSTLEDLKRESFSWGLVSRTGKPIVKAEIRKILTNPFYYGLFRWAGEVHQATHQPILSKELFDQVQVVLKERCRPQKRGKHRFPFLGLTKCEMCGCSYTAERQKGHHYYRCTRKREKCVQPFIREEVLAAQVKDFIQAVALPSEIHQKMLRALAKEREDSTQPVAQKRLQAEISVLKVKLDRLLDAQLDGLVDKSEYLQKKEILLQQKVELEEKLGRLEAGATGWVEPTRAFLTAAHSAGELANSSDLESQKDFLKKIGSNFRLAAKTLRMDYENPWKILAQRSENEKIEKWRALEDSNF